MQYNGAERAGQRRNGAGAALEMPIMTGMDTMNLRKTLIAGLASCLAIASLAAQGSSAATGTAAAGDSGAQAEAYTAEVTTFAPFINRLRVAVKEPQVRLTWEDIANFTGSYRIYRHTQELTSDNLAKAELAGEVAQGEQFYTDIPAKTGAYFYAVLAMEKGGNVYQVFIPFRNKTLTAVNITIAAKAEDLTSEISAFKAEVVGQSIEVRLASSRNTRSIAVFRGTAPLLTRDDIIKAVQIWTGTGRSVKVQDFAVPGVPYYYAAVDTEAFQKNTWTVARGKNSLDKAVEIPLGNRNTTVSIQANQKPIRVMPLPILTLPDIGTAQPVLDGTNQITVNQPLDGVTKARIEALTAGLKSGMASKKSPELLPSDRIQLEGRSPVTATGEAKTLAEILAKDFTRTNWDESIRQLSNLLTLSLPRDLQAKAHFYLAQSHYLNGHYKEALMEFLFVQDELPDHAQPWIDNTLERSREW
jgi:hypothetical protein